MTHIDNILNDIMYHMFKTEAELDKLVESDQVDTPKYRRLRRESDALCVAAYELSRL